MIGQRGKSGYDWNEARGGVNNIKKSSQLGPSGECKPNGSTKIAQAYVSGIMNSAGSIYIAAGGGSCCCCSGGSSSITENKIDIIL